MHVELPSGGASFSAGESIVGIESVKTAADVYAPVDCEVTEVNDRLGDAPELLNSEPQGAGWLAKFKFTDGSSLDGLMEEGAYEEFCKEDN